MSSIYVTGAWISTIILVLLTFISRFSKNPKKDPKNPPGSTGWPVIGETWSYVSNPKKFILDRMAKHSSELFTTSLGSEKMVAFCGPTANKCIFANDPKVFNFWLPASIDVVLCYPKVNSDTHVGKSSEGFFNNFLRSDSIQRYVPLIDSMVQDHLNTYWDSRDQVKVHVLAKEFMMAACLRVLLNDTSPNPDEVRKLKEPVMLALEGLFSVPVNFPGTAFNKAIKGSRIFQEHVVDIIKQRKLTISNQNDDSGCQDLLSKMIVDSVKSGRVMSNEDMAKSINGLIFAGFYPTSTTITFTIAYLAEHPDVYQKVLQEQQEIANSKGVGEPLTWVDVQKMKYSWNVIFETLRLKSPIPGNFITVMADFT
ncbi:hypothetical protein RND81_05G096200 [Saponaria officinalis]|uniref:Cytochrome P450 n=1 Tax=Saponaria officinalis TaxID=3572 RepID=A0AAW1KZH2_SAPOF